MHWRWNELNEREKQIALLAVKNTKLATIGSELGISRSRACQIQCTVFRLLDVQDRVELSFLIGRHWEEIQKESRLVPAGFSSRSQI